jgi:hypothetical protein
MQRTPFNSPELVSSQQSAMQDRELTFIHDQLEEVNNKLSKNQKIIAGLQGDFSKNNAEYETMLRAPQGDQDYVHMLREMKARLERIRQAIIKMKLEKDQLEAMRKELGIDISQRHSEIYKRDSQRANESKQEAIIKLNQDLESLALALPSVTPDPVKESREILKESKEHLLAVVAEEKTMPAEVAKIIIDSAEKLVEQPEDKTAAKQLINVVHESQRRVYPLSAKVIGSILAVLGAAVIALSVSAGILSIGMAAPLTIAGVTLGVAMIVMAAAVLCQPLVKNSMFAHRSHRESHEVIIPLVISANISRQ